MPTSTATSGTTAVAMKAGRKHSPSGSTSMTAAVPPALTMSGDAERLREALDNLVSNAIKYSHPGGAIDPDAPTVDGSVPPPPARWWRR